MSKKKILTGHVARLIDGVLVSAGPGDVAPDWVTNPALIADGGDAVETTASTLVAGAITAEKIEAGAITVDKIDASTENKDEFSDLGIEALRELATEAGVAKSGSKKDIANRLRAKRDADAAAESNSDGDTGRDELIAKATALGTEGAEDMTDAELAAVIEQGE